MEEDEVFGGCDSLEGFDDRVGWIGRSREDFQHFESTRFRIGPDAVGEGASGVDSDAEGLGQARHGGWNARLTFDAGVGTAAGARSGRLHRSFASLRMTRLWEFRSNRGMCRGSFSIHFACWMQKSHPERWSGAQ